MSNPYLQPSDDLQPQPLPVPIAAWQPSLALIALLVAVAGLFFPGGIDFDKLPNPTPIPPFVEPEPQPKPVIDIAKTEGAWVVVVEQTEKRTLEQAKLMRDLPFWKSIEARGLKWRHYDYDADDSKAYRELADKVGLPAVVIVGGKGELLSKVLDKFPLPAKEALNAKIKEVTGR